MFSVCPRMGMWFSAYHRAFIHCFVQHQHKILCHHYHSLQGYIGFLKCGSCHCRLTTTQSECKCVWQYFLFLSLLSGLFLFLVHRTGFSSVCVGPGKFTVVCFPLLILMRCIMTENCAQSDSHNAHVKAAVSKRTSVCCCQCNSYIVTIFIHYCLIMLNQYIWTCSLLYNGQVEDMSLMWFYFYYSTMSSFPGSVKAWVYFSHVLLHLTHGHLCTIFKVHLRIDGWVQHMGYCLHSVFTNGVYRHSQTHLRTEITIFFHKTPDSLKIWHAFSSA